MVKKDKQKKINKWDIKENTQEMLHLLLTNRNFPFSLLAISTYTRPFPARKTWLPTCFSVTSPAPENLTSLQRLKFKIHFFHFFIHWLLYGSKEKRNTERSKLKLQLILSLTHMQVQVIMSKYTLMSKHDWYNVENSIFPNGALSFGCFVYSIDQNTSLHIITVQSGFF